VLPINTGGAMLGSFRNFLVAGAVVACIAGALPAMAQSDSTGPKKTFRDSAREKREKLDEQLRDRQARIKAKQEADWRAAQATQRKRAICGKRAKEQHLHLLKRRRFMKKCMAEL
jgi:hypothetical protein